MSYQERGYIGYGIDIDELKEKHIDCKKIKNLFLNNKYDINKVFGLNDEDIQNICKAKSTKEILELEVLSEYESDDYWWYNYNPLAQIVALVLNQKNYGFEAAYKDQSLQYIYLPACMPWEMCSLSNLTKKEVDTFVNEALKEIYKEKYCDKIPQMDYVNCVSGG